MSLPNCKLSGRAGIEAYSDNIKEIPPLASIGFILEDTSLFQALIILQLAQYFVHHPIGKCSTFSITIAD